LKFKTLKFKNNFGIYYLIKIDGKELEKISKADIRRIENKNDKSGMQRTLNTERRDKISEYISTDYATFPNSVILKLNNHITYNIGEDYIEIPAAGENTFTIIDGQHRIAAFKQSLRSFEIPAAVYVDINDRKMIEIFRTVNSTQKPVNPSLRMELESESMVPNPEKFAVNLAYRFAFDTDSPLKNRIIMYGDEKDEKVKGKQTLSFYALSTEILNLIYNDKHYHTIKDYLYNFEFPEAISKYLNAKRLNEEKYVLWNYYSSDSLDRSYKLLNTYFLVISELFESDWKDEKSLLVKSVGIRALMRLFIVVYFIGRKKRNFTKSYIEEILSPLKAIDKTINGEKYSGSSFALATKIYNDMYKLIDKNL
jgi:DGQHR domain-containing protein